MYRTFRSELVESEADQDSRGFMFASARPAVTDSLILQSTPESLPLERSTYGAKRTNWLLIGAIMAAHVILLAMLVTMDVIHITKPKRAPLVVALIPLDTVPPPEKAASPTPENQEVPRIVEPVVITAAPIVKVLAPPPPIVAAPLPPAPPAPVAAPPAVMKVSDLDTKMISATPPRYPVEARRRKEQGTVQLDVVLGLDGGVAEVRIARSSGFDRLDKAALDAVRRWRWSPTLREGQAMMVRGVVDIPFILRA